MSRIYRGLLHAPGEADRPIVVPAAEPPTQGPLVSCLMVSRGHLFPARYAIECFRRQTYANRELVVVVDDPASDLPAHLDRLGNPTIRLIELPSQRRTLGELRNIAVASAHGEFVCQWDDDDLYSPERLGLQFAALREGGAVACVLRRWTIWWPDASRLAISGGRLWEGSILARTRDLPPYPALRRGEDTEMVEALTARSRVVGLDVPELYVYVRHRGNTFGEPHFTSLYNFSRKRWIGGRCDEQLASLAATVPVRQYAAELDREGAATRASPQAGRRAPPLVSIVVRSMGRPHLGAVLASLAAQDHPAIEVLVVDATGGNHPPLPAVAWPPGHTVRLVVGERPLTRPQAANAGLDALTGDWFGFLDDDDTFDADHVSTLVGLGESTTDLAVYAMSRLLDADGETTSLAGLPFNPAVVFLAPLCSFPAALFRREVVNVGCRFDERLEIFEDQDFFRQVSLHSGFTRSPLATFNYHIEAGSSGTGLGANRDWTRGPMFEQRLRAKWAGERAYHEQRIMAMMRRALHAFHDGGDPERAAALLRSLLAAYPDEPNAFNALGHLRFEASAFDEAEDLLRRAVEINPIAAEYRFNLACVLECTGRHAEARRQLQAAVGDRRDARMHDAVLRMLARLKGPPDRRRDPSASAPVGGDTSRLAACPCGSSKRYKHCCGRPRAPAAASETDVMAQRALVAFGAGEADAAMDTLAAVQASAMTGAATAIACGDACREMQRYERAIAFYRQAAALGETLRVSTAVAQCCSAWYKADRTASMLRVARELVERIHRRDVRRDRVDGGDPTLHIVAALDKIGGSEHRALALHAWLSRHAPTRLWSTVPPLPAFAERSPITTIDEAAGRFPASGHMVFIGTYYEYGDWLARSRPSRVTICYNLSLPDTLIARLVALQDVPSAFTIDFTYPSRRFGEATGLPGVVEYAAVDVERFRPVRSRRGGTGPLVIGRHSRDDQMKYHPNDPSLFRRLVREGHRLEIVGGTCLAAALAPDVPAGGIALRPEGAAVVPFLEGLDCFLYRAHPDYYETGGTVILEAMAMALPVVVFGDVGVAELIDDGRNGYLVGAEDEAFARIRALQRDPRLRQSVGAAARETVVATMRALGQSMLDHYLSRCVSLDAR